MPLPSNDELREMLGYASAYPWQHRAGAIHPNNDDATWVVAIVDDEDGQVCLDDDIDLMLLAPQLAEEVIRLREEVDMMADFYRRMRDVAAEKFVRTEEGSTNASTLGFLLTLYTRVIDRLERIKEGGDE